MSISIRRATIDDLSSICDLSQSIFNHEREFTNEFNMNWSHAKEGKEFFYKRLKGKTSCIFLAFDGETTVGYILITLQKYAWRAFLPIAEVTNLGVLPSYRSKGIGTMLIQKAKTYAMKRGAKRMSVETLEGNIRAVDFYKRCGFTDFSRTMLMKLL